MHLNENDEVITAAASVVVITDGAYEVGKEKVQEYEDQVRIQDQKSKERIAIADQRLERAY